MSTEQDSARIAHLEEMLFQVRGKLARTEHHRDRLDEAMRFAIEHQLDTSPHDLAQRINQILSDV